jgi:valyl-tRNA synthetase
MKIPKNYKPTEKEGKILDFWLENNFFHAEITPDKKPFTIVIPPPNVTGILHMGHALNNTIQDVIIRYQRMQQCQTLWMPGTDHAGIATQNVVERKLAKDNIRKEDIGRDKFLEHLWDWKKQYGSTILNQLKKIGASCDWQRTRFTMDEAYNHSVNEAFVRLYQEGLVYRSNYIINWCPSCRTALSDEEAPYSEKDGFLYYIKYPVLNSEQQILDYIMVATTRPETMLGDTAIAMHPGDQRYQWLTDESNSIMLPLLERKLRLIKDEAVDPEFGTGLVKVTPAHDPLDFSLGKKHNLQFINIMHSDAKLNENAGTFKGLDRFQARKKVVEALDKQGLIEKKEPYKIRAGHCYRCDTMIEPRLSLQWFVNMKPLAKEAIEVVKQGKVKFYPPRWKKVYLNWMENIQDWCISRQIWWGHRIPVWYCQDCQDSPDIVAREKPEKCPECGSKSLMQETDVLDTWFSSWLWPFATLYWPQETDDLKYFYPTNCLVTASEILFFWVARMIMSGLKFMGQIPFDKVIIHGTVRDNKGVKMSKSLGNTIDPLDIVNNFGADALRFSLMLLASTGSDVYLSQEKFLVGRNFANKIWNASRFILQKIDEQQISIEHDTSLELDDIDKWLIKNLNQTIKNVTDNLNNYCINDATKEVYHFFWHIYCDWYIEISKNQLSPQKIRVLLTCLLNCLKLMHPVMPFISEDLYQILKNYLPLKQNSLTCSEWPQLIDYDSDCQQEDTVESLITLVKEVRNLKTDLGLPSSVKLDVAVVLKPALEETFKRHLSWIKHLAGIKEVKFKNTLARVLYKSNNLELNFIISDIDLDKYTNSLNKKIAKLEKDLNQTKAKLNNSNFVNKAPQRVVDNARQKADELPIKIKRLGRIKDAIQR